MNTCVITQSQAYITSTQHLKLVKQSSYICSGLSQSSIPEIIKTNDQIANSPTLNESALTEIYHLIGRKNNRGTLRAGLTYDVKMKTVRNVPGVKTSEEQKYKKDLSLVYI